MIFYIFSIAVFAFILWQAMLFWIALGHRPTGERLQRCKKSAQWGKYSFRNVLETPTMTSNKGFWHQLYKLFFVKVPDREPVAEVPHQKTNLNDIPRSKDVYVWLGHSSVYIQTAGKRFLFDPVLTCKLPVWWFMRPYKGADCYSPSDIPEIDYLIITHDHWDHLDMLTVKALKNRVRAVVCPLGVGAHFEYWGYDKDKIFDLDWNETFAADNNVKLHCLPTRHFSGRFGLPKALWASFMIESEKRNIFVSGDGGYDDRYKIIAKKFPNIDLAIMENGQYDDGWKYIHTRPSELPTAVSNLNPKRVVTYHHSKFSLARHAWYEPIDMFYQNSQNKPWQLLTPMIGEPFFLDENQTFSKWWKI